jgi:hypothetical protein
MNNPPRRLLADFAAIPQWGRQFERKENDMKPTRDDIVKAIADINAENRWLEEFDPEYDEPALFWANLFDPFGAFIVDGWGRTAGEAMAFAWIFAHDYDAVCEAHVDESVPAEVKDGWRFELGRPGEPYRSPPDSPSFGNA